ncbi:hypothetical protein C8F04DRAFT_1187031 [Mycena alexandri]|uniref:Uncharacterized protein n=1 Tax=Mycena alexandri TaxID=1745969 RepID=A0AAD6X2X7_9AGAR|nr:hypothetical protein C8F04DRAFT_1187031 [Mycena alexandri]
MAASARFGVSSHSWVGCAERSRRDAARVAEARGNVEGTGVCVGERDESRDGAEGGHGGGDTMGVGDVERLRECTLGCCARYSSSLKRCTAHREGTNRVLGMGNECRMRPRVDGADDVAANAKPANGTPAKRNGPGRRRAQAPRGEGAPVTPTLGIDRRIERRKGARTKEPGERGHGCLQTRKVARIVRAMGRRFDDVAAGESTQKVAGCNIWWGRRREGTGDPSVEVNKYVPYAMALQRERVARCASPHVPLFPQSASPFAPSRVAAA